MSRITQLFGATMIVGAGAIASQIEPLESKIDEALGEAKTYMQTEFDMTEKQALEFGLGSALLLALIGAGAIASGARNKLRADQKIHPDVRDVLEETNSELAETLFKLKHQVASMGDQIANMDNAVVALEYKVLEPLNIDLSAVEQAIAKLKDTEIAAGDTLTLIRSIETEVDNALAATVPRNFADDLSDAREEYKDAFDELLKSIKVAFNELDGDGHAGQYAKIMGKISQMDVSIKQSIVQGSSMDASAPTELMNVLAEMLAEVEEQEGQACYYFPEIVADATTYVQKATDYLLVSLEMRQIAQQPQMTANGVANGANPDTAPQQMHEDIDHNNPVLG